MTIWQYLELQVPVLGGCDLRRQSCFQWSILLLVPWHHQLHLTFSILGLLFSFADTIPSISSLLWHSWFLFPWIWMLVQASWQFVFLFSAFFKKFNRCLCRRIVDWTSADRRFANFPKESLAGNGNINLRQMEILATINWNEIKIWFSFIAKITK